MAEDNGLDLFGFSIKRKEGKNKKDDAAEAVSFVAPEDDSGTTVESYGSGHYGYQIDIDPTNVKSDAELVMKYRDAAQTIECDSAIEDIVNEAIVSDSNSAPASLITDDLKSNERLKKVLREEFDNVTRLLNFNDKALLIEKVIIVCI
jgi:hypothetical protein